MKLLKAIITFFLGIIILIGCNDLISDIKPSDELTQNQAVSNPNTVKGIRLRMYDLLHTKNFTTIYMLGPDALADGLIQRKGTNRLGQLLDNRYEAGMANSFLHASRTSYDVVYDLANIANTILNNIPKGVLTDKVLNRYKGEAYFFRAFSYFYLTNILGYMPGVTPKAGPGKGFDLGIIMRKKPTNGVQSADTLKSRSTVTEVYDQIKSDLKESIDLLSNNAAARSASVNWVKAPAAEAFLARVNLYSRDYKGANKYAEEALQNSNARIATKSEVTTMFNETVGTNPEAIFLLNVDPQQTSLGSGSLSGYTSTFWNAVLPSIHVLDLYSEGDVRRNAWYGPCSSRNVDDCQSNYQNSHIELEKWDGDKGQGADDVPYFRVSEMLLIETEARIHNPSLGDPLLPINKLRTQRGISTLNQVGIDNVLDERQREFVGEGQRFWDLKRLGRDIKKSGGRSTIPFTSFKVLDAVPPSEVELNPNLEQNPGYK